MCMSKPSDPKISLDQTAFTHLLEVGGTDLLLQLIDSFFKRSVILVETILQAMQKKDLESVQFACHTLKTQASYLGAHHLHQQTEALELLARKNAFSELQARLPDWEKTYHQSAQLIKEEQQKYIK